MVLLVISLARLSKWLGIGIEAAKGTDDIRLLHAEIVPPQAQGVGVRRLLRAEPTITAPVIGGTDGATAGMSHRTKAWCAMCHHDADRPTALAFDTDAVRRRIGLTPV